MLLIQAKVGGVDQKDIIGKHNNASKAVLK